MHDSLRLGRVLGFPVAVNWSVLVIVFLLAWGLARGVLPEVAPGHADAVYWATGVVGAGLLICSLMAHELAHAVVARKAGVEVEGLTLWMFGGIATLRGEPSTPKQDFRIAAAGPATSVVLALGFGLLGGALATTGQSDLLLGTTAWLAILNGMLAVFNLIPGAPLDGGRILRAFLWSRSGNRESAAIAAASMGQMVAYALVTLGVLAFISGDTVGGVWTLFIGWFLHTAARSEQAATLTGSLLRGVPVGSVMSTDVQVCDPRLTIDEFVSRHVFGGRHSAYPVVGPTGAVDGMVTLAQVRQMPPQALATTRVLDVAVPLSRIATCAPSDALDELLPRLTRESGQRALVFDAGRLVGILTPTDIAHAVEARTLLGQAHRR